MSPSFDGHALLEKHNPILVLYPQEPGSRSAPGERNPGPAGWGDYHPCSAPFFLARVTRRDRPKPYDIFGLLSPWQAPKRTGLANLKRKLASTPAKESLGWELDVADMPSQDQMQAWKVYGPMINEPQDPYERVVYGRFCQGPSGMALQYWYLYIYNDFWNNHEADWEMVVLEMKDDGSPNRIGISCHMNGWSCPWDDAPQEGDRPIVYVARGSHAGYFAYREKGHRAARSLPRLNFPLAIKFLKPLGQAAYWLLAQIWSRDNPPAEASRDSGAPAHHRGERKIPKLRIMPDGDPPADDPEWWWMRYRGKWGSTHSRISGFVGVDSPWGSKGHTIRWKDPVGWIRGLRKWPP